MTKLRDKYVAWLDEEQLIKDHVIQESKERLSSNNQILMIEIPECQNIISQEINEALIAEC